MLDHPVGKAQAGRVLEVAARITLLLRGALLQPLELLLIGQLLGRGGPILLILREQRLQIRRYCMSLTRAILDYHASAERMTNHLAGGPPAKLSCMSSMVRAKTLRVRGSREGWASRV